MEKLVSLAAMLLRRDLYKRLRMKEEKKEEELGSQVESIEVKWCKKRIEECLSEEDKINYEAMLKVWKKR